MPKAGIEPARGQAPLDFESSASTSSATSACSTAAHRNRRGLQGRGTRGHNRALPNGARRVLAPKQESGEEEEW